MTTLKPYNSKKIINQIDNVIDELNSIKKQLKDNDDFTEVLMTEEISLSKFKETEKTLKAPKSLRNDNLEKEYKDYMDKDSMPNMTF